MSILSIGYGDNRKLNRVFVNPQPHVKIADPGRTSPKSVSALGLKPAGNPTINIGKGGKRMAASNIRDRPSQRNYNLITARSHHKNSSQASMTYSNDYSIHEIDTGSRLPPPGGNLSNALAFELAKHSGARTVMQKKYMRTRQAESQENSSINLQTMPSTQNAKPPRKPDLYEALSQRGKSSVQRAARDNLPPLDSHRKVEMYSSVMNSIDSAHEGGGPQRKRIMKISEDFQQRKRVTPKQTINHKTFNESKLIGIPRETLNRFKPGLGEKVSSIVSNQMPPDRVHLKYGSQVPYRGDSLGRMPQTEVKMQQIRKLLPTLNQDQIKILNFESHLVKLREQQKKQRRQKELLEWAIVDYGIQSDPNDHHYVSSTNFTSTMHNNSNPAISNDDSQENLKSVASSRKPMRIHEMSMTTVGGGFHKPAPRLRIDNEYDFISKVKKKFIHKRNNENATRLQAFFRGALTRAWFKQMREDKLEKIILIQNYMRMKWARRAFLERLAIHYFESAIMVQKHLKGYLVFKEWKEALHEAIINRMTNHFKSMRQQLEVESQIIIARQWRIHAMRKAVKVEKKKRRELAAKAKKKGKYGYRAAKANASPSNPPTTLSLQKKDSTAQKPAGGLDIPQQNLSQTMRNVSAVQPQLNPIDMTGGKREISPESSFDNRKPDNIDGQGQAGVPPTFQVTEVGVESKLNSSAETKLADLNQTVPIPTSPRLDELAGLQQVPSGEVTEGEGEPREMPTVTNLSPDSELSAPLNDTMRGTAMQSDLVKINEHPGQEEEEDAASEQVKSQHGSQQDEAPQEQQPEAAEEAPIEE